MANTIQQELMTYFTRLNEQDQQSFLNILKNFLKNHPQSHTSVSIEDYNEDLDAAMARIANNEYTTLEELEKEMETW